MISLIVAIDANGGIGANNTMPWHLPDDLKHFKRTTSGHPVIMGRKTFDSIGKPLPGRRNLVVSRNPAWHHDGAETVGSVGQALQLTGDADVFIIGGAQIFAQTMTLADRLIVTEIAHSYECDAFFPAIDPQLWRETARESGVQDGDGLAYAFVTYEKKK